MKKVVISLVKGSEGYSLQITDKDGNGYRYAGPKAWGNPTNIPTAEFIVDLENFIKCLQQNSYEDDLERVMKDKWIILLKFNDNYWKPYFKDTGWTNTNPSKFHCFDYEYAKKLYDKVCKNFSTSQWMLVKLEELYNAPLEEFKYIKGD